MAWKPPEFRPDDLPPIEDVRTYEVIKRMTETMEADLATELGDAPIPGFAQRLITSLRWRLREWENKQR